MVDRGLLEEFRYYFPNEYDRAMNLRERNFGELLFDTIDGKTYVFDQFMDTISREDNRSPDNPRTPEEWRREFAFRFRRCMNRINMTQQELAEAIGVSQPTVGNWYQGKTTPSVEHAVKIAHELGRDVSEFLDFY